MNPVMALMLSRAVQEDRLRTAAARPQRFLDVEPLGGATHRERVDVWAAIAAASRLAFAR